MDGVRGRFRARFPLNGYGGRRSHAVHNIEIGILCIPKRKSVANSTDSPTPSLAFSARQQAEWWC